MDEGVRNMSYELEFIKERIGILWCDRNAEDFSGILKEIDFAIGFLEKKIEGLE